MKNLLENSNVYLRIQKIIELPPNPSNKQLFISFENIFTLISIKLYSQYKKNFSNISNQTIPLVKMGWDKFLTNQNALFVQQLYSTI